MDAVRDDERVWRDVYHSRQKKHLDRPVEERRFNSETKTVFGTRKAPIKEISTSLYDRVDLEFATSAGDHRTKQVNGATKIYGWFLMPVYEAATNNRLVESSPQPDNCYHANIVLPDGEWETWEDGEVHLRHFLAIGTWQDRAGPLASS